MQRSKQSGGVSKVRNQRLLHCSPRTNCTDTALLWPLISPGAVPTPRCTVRSAVQRMGAGWPYALCGTELAYAAGISGTKSGTAHGAQIRSAAMCGTEIAYGRGYGR
eukprot:3013212-Rhodomonas_salina.2